MIYFSLFYEFFKIGLFAVGGGLATIPFLRALAESSGWFSLVELTDMIAVSEATPGPIGVNMATYAGWNVSGILGSLAATLSLVLPSVIVIIIVSRFMNKFRENRFVTGALAAIRPAGSGLIACAVFEVLFVSVISPAVSDIFAGGILNGNYTPFILYALFTAAVILSERGKKKPLHPAIFIAAGAAIGIALGQMGVNL